MKTNRKILVVDDDPVIGRSFERVLSTKGYAVINCHSGKDALEKLQNEEYDAVFTDLKMPEMDGIEVASRIKASQPWMPVVIVTGYATTSAQQQATKLGTQFIQKPLTPEMIESMADSAMSEKESHVVSEPETVVETVETQSKAIAVLLFLAAPFIGLLYALALPIVGLAMLLNLAVKALLKNKKVQLALSPFVGLAFVLALPLIGVGMIAYTGAQALTKNI